MKDDGVVGVDDVDRWPVDSDAFGFLSALSTTKSIESLKEVWVRYFRAYEYGTKLPLATIACP